MKNGQLFDRQIGIHFHLEHYVMDISKTMACVLDPVEWKKHTFWQRLQITLVLALRALSRLKRSIYFRREEQWQSQFSENIAMLTNPALSANEMKAALHQANDLIEAAHRTSATRAAIAASVQEKTILSAEQEKCYQAVRQVYESQNHQLNQLEGQVSAVQREYNLSRPRHQGVVTFKPSIPRSLPRELFAYAQEKEELRIVEDSLAGYIPTDKDSRTLYQALGKKLISEKPTLEKVKEDRQAAQLFLQNKSQRILTHAESLRAHISQHMSDAIEHRTQTILAHADKKERLLACLDKVIELIQPLLSAYERRGQSIITEIQQQPASSALANKTAFFMRLPEKGRLLAQLLLAVYTAKSAVGHQKLTLEQATDVQQKIEAIGAVRTAFTTSLTSSWSAFFSEACRARRKQELLLNTQLEAQTAQMAHLVYGLKDVNAVISSEQVQRKQISTEKLKALEAPIAQEQKKIAQIPISFGR